LAQKGATPWNKGIPRTEAVKKKLSDYRKEYYKTHEHPRGMLGKKHTEEAKRKIRENASGTSYFSKKAIEKGRETFKRNTIARRILFVCPICKSEKLLSPQRFSRRKHCSYKCAGIAKRIKPSLCIKCGSKLTKSKENKYKLCWKCVWPYLVANRKNNGYVYRTSENRQARSTSKYQRWRNRVFKRDNYICQMCFGRGGKLQADHIKPFAFFPKLRFVLSNGRTLCVECHKTTDTYLKNTYINDKNN